MTPNMVPTMGAEYLNAPDLIGDFVGQIILDVICRIVFFVSSIL